LIIAEVKEHNGIPFLSDDELRLREAIAAVLADSERGELTVCPYCGQSAHG